MGLNKMKRFFFMIATLIFICTFSVQADAQTVHAEENYIDVSNIKLVYFIGDEFDTMGIKCMYKGFEISPSMINVEGFTSATTGDKTVKLSYGELNVSFRVTVFQPVTEIRLISVTHKTSYFTNEKLSVADLKIQLVYKSGERKNVNVDEKWVKGFDTTSPVDKQTLIIDFGGITTTYDIEVKEILFPDKNYVETKLDDSVANALRNAENPAIKAVFFVVWGVAFVVIAGTLVLTVIKRKRGV